MAIEKNEHYTKYISRKIVFIFSIIFILISCDTIGPPTPLPEYESIDEAPAWSPDGEWIAYWHFNPIISDTTYPTGLYIIDSNGVDRKLFVHGYAYNPDWSPDGEKIVFTNGNIFIIDVNTKEINQLTEKGSDFFPNWSPDSTKISFDRSGTSDTVGTWIIDLITLTQNRFGFFSQLDWAPSNDKIVYSGSSDSKKSNSQIWLASSDGSNQQKLSTNDFLDNRYPKWSTDNNRIVWEVSKRNTIYSEIWIMDNDGKNQYYLVEGYYPSWSPDNKRIVCSKPVDDKIALFIIDIATKEIKQITF